jgi:hypothetical protein
MNFIQQGKLTRMAISLRYIATGEDHVGLLEILDNP